MASCHLSHEYDSNDITFLSNSQELMGVAATSMHSVELHVVLRPYESLRFLPFLYNIVLLLFNALNLLYWWHSRDLKADGRTGLTGCRQTLYGGGYTMKGAMGID